MSRIRKSFITVHCIQNTINNHIIINLLQQQIFSRLNKNKMKEEMFNSCNYPTLLSEHFTKIYIQDQINIIQCEIRLCATFTSLSVFC